MLRVACVDAWPRGRRSTVFDGAIAFALVALDVTAATSRDAVTPAALTVIVLTGLPLALRRVVPLPVLAVTMIGRISAPLLGGEVLGLTVLVAVYTTAVLCERRVSLAALAPTAIVSAAIDASGAGSASVGVAVGVASAALTVAAWSVGAYVQTQRRFVRTLEERALAAEREREQLAVIAVHEQRAAIARELHDIVAHSVSVMLVGVRGARDVLRSSPDVAEQTLMRVEQSGEHSLVELRRILTLLRDPRRAPESRPQPSLAQLDRLLADYRSIGLSVELERDRALPPLPEGVELSVYRIVEEALTNALKHSHPTLVTVALAHRDRQLELEIVNDGLDRTGGTSAVGHGLIGMRERVALLGGRLEAGRAADDGFRIAVRLPVEAAR